MEPPSDRLLPGHIRRASAAAAASAPHLTRAQRKNKIMLEFFTLLYSLLRPSSSSSTGDRGADTSAAVPTDVPLTQSNSLLQSAA